MLRLYSGAKKRKNSYTILKKNKHKRKNGKLAVPDYRVDDNVKISSHC